ncbi:hypothetical protein QYF36_023032 [Acer negundo]|nr:hypothetical protein QYF36_023032 [Acer negundo]
MEKIEHTTIHINGINMHVVSIGTDPVVLFLHGIPELWYSWRHQLFYLSSCGYRAIAPNLHRPNRVKALVNTSVTFYPKNPARKPMDGFRALFGDDYYICRPNRVKALVNTSVAFYPINPTRKPMDSFRPCSMMIIISAGTWIAQIDTAKLVKRFLSSRSPKPPCIPKETGYRDLPDPPALPSWLSEEDVNYYAAKFSQKGFTGGLNYYRYLNLTWELAAPWTAVQIKVPVKFIVGDLDLGYNIPGTKEYIHNGGFKKDVPLLQEVVMEGVSHFLNQEKPERQS